VIDAIVTVPPYATFIREVLRHPIVSGIRLNTVMPLTGEGETGVVRRLDELAREHGKTLAVDLKGRQLRVATYGVPPFTSIELSHAITVPTPTTAYFSDGEEEVRVLAVDGKRLVLEDGPRRVVGPGESVNIPDPGLRVDGTLTDTDKRYVEACARQGIGAYMLSFVERPEDVTELKALDPKTPVIAKIESRKGLAYAGSAVRTDDRLMAARGDLYVELRPHEMGSALDTIIAADPKAIAASRIFPSLARGPVPAAPDIGDIDNPLRAGYRTFMLGDDVCQRRESALGALNLLEAIAERYR
jgi:pyruvate kinase